MRFCPFCSAENADDLAVCQACGRRLPPLPPRRAPGARNAPPTGITLPQRPAGSSAPRPPASPSPRAGNTLPPPVQKAALGGGTNTIVGGGWGEPDVDSTTVQPESTATTVSADPLAGDSVVGGDTMNADSITMLGGETPPPDFENTTVGAPPVDMTVPSAPAYRPPPSPPPARSKPPSIAPPSGSRDSAPALPAPPVAGKAAELRNAINPGPAAQRREAPPPGNDPRVVADRRGRNDSQQPIPSIARTKTPSQAPPMPAAAFGAAPSVPAVKSTVLGQPAMRPPTQPPPPSASGPRAKPLTAPPPVPPTPGAGLPRPKTASVPPPSPFPPPSAPRPAPSQFDGDTFLTDNDTKAAPDTPAAPAWRDPSGPPPTRIHRPDLAADRPFTPPSVLPVPEIPEPGLVKSARYAYDFARARWQRRGAIKQLGVEIKQDTEALDQVLGALGRAARGARVEGRVFSAENAAITEAEGRIHQLNTESAEVEGRKAEENSKFVDVERERNAKLTEAERMVEEAGRELTNLEAQRRGLRDKRKELERRQKAYQKAAEDHDRQAGTAPLGEARQELRTVSEGHRREAAALEPERQEVDRQIGALERPIGEVTARLDAGKAELDAAKRSLNDAREGHTHRLAELDAEQKRKTREIGLAESEIARRLVTLGTLVNLNRIEDPQFGELYQRIDRLRGAITSRTTEVEKLTAERSAYDRGTLVRGLSTIGGAVVLLIALIVILLAIL